MQSVILRGGIVAAATTVFALGYGLAPEARAQPVAADEAVVGAGKAVAAKGAWVATKAYVLDDLVTSRGSTWRAKRANTNKLPGSTIPSTAKDWELFAAGLNPVGAWLGSSTYQRNDLVTYQGATWRALRTIVGKTPVAGAGWELVAAKGETGEVGAAGPTGATGATGPAGPNTGIGAGTQGAPSFSFTGDPDTGIFSPSAGTIALVQDGAFVLHTRGTGSTALGVNALPNATGPNNTAIGVNSLLSNTTGNNNTAIGGGSLLYNTDGERNVAMGVAALRENTSGDYSTAIGTNALYSNTTGDYNTSLGAYTLAFMTTGSNNIAIGWSAGRLVSTTSDNIFIGNEGENSDSATIKIGTHGTQTSAFIAGIAGVPLTGDQVVIDATTGQLGVASPSSRHLKEAIQPMAGIGAQLQQLRPVTFRYKAAMPDGSKPLQYGLIAEEVAETLPALALYEKDGTPRGVAYHMLPSMLLAGYQQQQMTIEAQATKIDAQAAKIEALEEKAAKVDALEQRLSAIEAMLPRVTKAAAVH